MTDIVNDTFVAANGTKITAYVGPQGHWVREYTFDDVTTDANWWIQGNTLQRSDFLGGYSDLYIHAPLSPSTTHHSVEVGMVCNATGLSFEFALLARGYTVPDNGFGQAVEDGIEAYLGFYTQLHGRWSGGGGTITTISPTAGTHVLRLDVNGTLAELFWDGVSMGSQTVTGITGVTPLGFVTPGYAALALGNGSFSAPGDTHFTYFKVSEVVPTSFWTDFNRTSETL